jgi:hypothetical protein
MHKTNQIQNCRKLYLNIIQRFVLALLPRLCHQSLVCVSREYEVGEAFGITMRTTCHYCSLGLVPATGYPDWYSPVPTPEWKLFLPSPFQFTIHDLLLAVNKFCRYITNCREPAIYICRYSFCITTYLVIEVTWSDSNKTLAHRAIRRSRDGTGESDCTFYVSVWSITTWHGSVPNRTGKNILINN